MVTDVTIQSVGMPSAEICFIDTLKSGFEVLLVVTPDNQRYFVIGKVPMGSITKMPITIQGITSCTNHTATEGGYQQESRESKPPCDFIFLSLFYTK